MDAQTAAHHTTATFDVQNMNQSKTAEELIKELNNDSEFLKRKKGKEDHIQQLAEVCAKDEEELVSELNNELSKIDCHITSVWDLVNSVNSYQVVYPILQKHLFISHHSRIREGIIRALTVKDVGKDIETALFECFKDEQNQDIKWILANALKTVMPYYRRKNYQEIKKVYKTKN